MATVRLLEHYIIAGFRNGGTNEQGNGFKLEVATGRSTCRGCGEKIAKGESALFGFYDFSCNYGSWTSTAIWFHQHDCMPIHPSLLGKVYDLESAKAWIRSINDADLLFHFEDDPATIDCFNRQEAELVRQRVAALYEQDWSSEHICPIGYALSIQPNNA